MTENEKKLVDNLAKKANEAIEQGHDSQEVLNYINGIKILKES